MLFRSATDAVWAARGYDVLYRDDETDEAGNNYVILSSNTECSKPEGNNDGFTSKRHSWLMQEARQQHERQWKINLEDEARKLQMKHGLIPSAEQAAGGNAVGGSSGGSSGGAAKGATDNAPSAAGKKNIYEEIWSKLHDKLPDLKLTDYMFVDTKQMQTLFKTTKDELCMQPLLLLRFVRHSDIFNDFSMGFGHNRAMLGNDSVICSSDPCAGLASHDIAWGPLRNETDEETAPAFQQQLCGPCFQASKKHLAWTGQRNKGREIAGKNKDNRAMFARHTAMQKKLKMQGMPRDRKSVV